MTSHQFDAATEVTQNRTPMARLQGIPRNRLVAALAVTLTLAAVAFALGRALGGDDAPQLTAPHLTPVAPAQGDALVVPAPIKLPRKVGR